MATRLQEKLITSKGCLQDRFKFCIFPNSRQLIEKIWEFLPYIVNVELMDMNNQYIQIALNFESYVLVYQFKITPKDGDRFRVDDIVSVNY